MTMTMDFAIPAPKPERWLLALESSTATGGAALLRNGDVQDAIELEEGLRHGRDLMPAVAGLLSRRGFGPAAIWAVAVSIGPGSYTGTRVGVMAAKAFAFAARCKLAAVSSLAALAQSFVMEHATPPGDLVMTVQDARRDEVYVGLYQAGDDGMVDQRRPDIAVTPEEAVAFYDRIKEFGTVCHPVGSGFATYDRLFRDHLADGFSLVHPRAGAVGRLGWRQLSREQSADPLSLQPLYLRRDPDADWSRDSLIS